MLIGARVIGLPIIPEWLGWLIVLSPLVGLAWFGWRQRAELRRLRNQDQSSRSEPDDPESAGPGSGPPLS